MFTGIIRELGKVEEISQDSQGAVLRISCRRILPQLQTGDSVSVNGCCLTAEAVQEGSFRVAATPETLRRSSLGRLRGGCVVNLEPSMKPDEFLGGHLVQGHVDGAGQVDSMRREGNSVIFRFSVPRDIIRHCVLKGSIAIEGVSLTISDLGRDWLEVTIIPHTWEVTSFSSLDRGDRVNLESDVISKYVEKHVQRILQASGGNPASGG